MPSSMNTMSKAVMVARTAITSVACAMVYVYLMPGLRSTGKRIIQWIGAVCPFPIQLIIIAHIQHHHHRN